MNFFQHVLEGAKIGAKVIEKTIGNGFYHASALTAFIFINILVSSASLEFKLYSLFISLTTAWLAIKFANSIKK